MEEKTQTDFQAKLTDPKGSAIKKYQYTVIGSKGILFLLKYEAITSFFGGLPGALGLLLRKIFYKQLLGKVGQNSIFGRNITIRHPKKIFIGNNVVIDDNCVLDAKGSSNKGIIIGDNVVISRNTVLSCKDGSIEIGNNVNFAINCIVHSESNVEIGENTLIASFCYIIGGGMHRFERTDIPIIQQGSISKGIVIEKNVWLGADVKVLDGVRIGKDSIIGTGAVVNADIPEFSIAAGVPAKIIRKRI